MKLGLVALALLLASGCRHKDALPIDAGQKQFFARGRFLYHGDQLIGEGGKTCNSCHEKDRPFAAHELARKIYDLPSSIAHCLLTRSKHEPQDNTAQEVRALQAYVIHRFVHDGTVQDENQEGIRRLGEAMHLFLAGEYDQALEEVTGAHSLIRSSHYHVRALILEGCIHVFRLNPDLAKDAFAEAVRIDPVVKIDANLFSPKVSAVLEETRLAAASP